MSRYLSFNCIWIIMNLSVLFAFTANSAEIRIIPQPSRIGGTVTIGNQQLTQENDDNFIFVITRTDGTLFFPPIKLLNGLNEFNWYVINVPIYEVSDQPDAARAGDNAVIHVYYNDAELNVLSPKNGNFIVGESGSRTQIDLLLEPPGIICKGDINGDAFIDLKDIILILKICNNLSGLPVYLEADTNGNGKIDLYDSLFVLQTIANQSNHNNIFFQAKKRLR